MMRIYVLLPMIRDVGCGVKGILRSPHVGKLVCSYTRRGGHGVSNPRRLAKKNGVRGHIDDIR